MPSDVHQYLLTNGKQIVYSGVEIQERDSVLCGYWCLYSLLERQRGRTIFETIHNLQFVFSDQSIDQSQIYQTVLQNKLTLLPECVAS